MLIKNILTIILVSLALGYPHIATSAGAPVDLTGDWLIDSSVGGGTPIKVHCTLIQQGETLSGTCTPEMESPQASELSGSVAATSAQWAYDVVFNGNPGKVEFRASEIKASSIQGVLSLSGTEAPFNAVRE